MSAEVSRVLVAVLWAQAQVGADYLLGAKPRLDAMRIVAADCSGLARTALAITGIKQIQSPDSAAKLPIGQWNGTWTQFKWMVHTSVPYALDHVGMFLCREQRPGGHGHIALSLGEGRTVEARGSKYGVCIVPADQQAGRGWDFGGKVRDLFQPWEGSVEDLATFLRRLYGDK